MHRSCEPDSYGPGQPSPPIWPCSTRGFPCPRHYCRGGGLLPHLFTLAKCARPSQASFRFFRKPAAEVQASLAVCSLWHFPWLPCRTSLSHIPKRTPLALTGALPRHGRLSRARHSWSPDFPPVFPSIALGGLRVDRRSPGSLATRHYTMNLSVSARRRPLAVVAAKEPILSAFQNGHVKPQRAAQTAEGTKIPSLSIFCKLHHRGKLPGPRKPSATGEYAIIFHEWPSCRAV